MEHLLFSEIACALFLGYIGTMLALQSWTLVAWFPAFVASYLLFAKEAARRPTPILLRSLDGVPVSGVGVM